MPHFIAMITNILSSTATTLAQSWFPISLALLGLGILIGFHELGHFLFCKLFDVATPSFSIGFGPRLFSRKIGETTFSLSLIPFGGYVEIAGLEEVGQGEQKGAGRLDDRAFRSKPYLAKMLILSGGILFNMLFALLILIPLCMTQLPPIPLIDTFRATSAIGTILDGSPAAKAGFMVGDVITAVNDTHITPGPGGALEALTALRAARNQALTLTVDRNSATVSQAIERAPHEKIGVSFAPAERAPLSFGAAVVESHAIIWGWVSGIASSISGLLLRAEGSDSVGGAFAIAGMLTQSAKDHLGSLLVALCFISVNLALMNLIPLPIFDGGQMVWETVETVLGRSFTLARTVIHTVTAVLVIILMLLLSGRDLYRLWRP